MFECLNKKLASRPCSTPVLIQEHFSRYGLLLVAFGAIGFGRQPKGLFTVVADSAICLLFMVRLGNLRVFLHFEDFCMAGVTFRIRHLHVRFMAEKYSSLRFGFILYIPPAHFFLSEGRAHGYEAQDADADYHDPPESIAHFLTSFPSAFLLGRFIVDPPFSLYARQSIFKK
jgi:hypothetical protein